MLQRFFSKYRALTSREDKVKWLLIAIFATISAFAELFVASFIAFFVTLLTLPETAIETIRDYDIFGYFQPYAQHDIIIHSMFFLAFIFITKNLFVAFEIYYRNRVAHMMDYRFRKKLLHHISQQNYLYILKHNSAYFLKMMESDSRNVFSNGVIALATLFSEGAIIFIFAIIIIVKNPFFALILLIVMMSISAIMLLVMMPKFYQLGKEIQKQGINTAQYLLQFIHGYRDIKIKQKSVYFMQQFNQYAFKSLKASMISNTILEYPRLCLETIVILLFIALLFTTYITSNDSIAVLPAIGGYVYIGFRLMPGINRIITKINTLKQMMPSLNRLYNEYQGHSKNIPTINIPNFQFHDRLSISNLHFSFEDRLIINKLNLEIKKHDTVGIIGKTGTGKSTLINLIMGIIHPDSGEILVDGKYPVHCVQWQQKIGFVPQSLYLLDDTIAKNIAFGEENINYQKIETLIDKLQLRDLIKQYDDGVNTMIGERGVKLSGGEAQRLSIARALYHEPEILIFDEATSALDNDTEAKIMDVIYELQNQYTIIIIAHRLTTLDRCNKIIDLS